LPNCKINSNPKK